MTIPSLLHRRTHPRATPAPDHRPPTEALEAAKQAADDTIAAFVEEHGGICEQVYQKKDHRIGDLGEYESAMEAIRIRALLPLITCNYIPKVYAFGGSQTEHDLANVLMMREASGATHDDAGSAHHPKAKELEAKIVAAAKTAFDAAKAEYYAKQR